MQKSWADLHLLVVDPLTITSLSETKKHKDLFMILMWNINLVNNDISSDSFLKLTSCFIERNKLNWKSRITSLTSMNPKRKTIHHLETASYNNSDIFKQSKRFGKWKW